MYKLVFYNFATQSLNIAYFRKTGLFGRTLDFTCKTLSDRLDKYVIVS